MESKKDALRLTAGIQKAAAAAASGKSALEGTVATAAATGASQSITGSQPGLSTLGATGVAGATGEAGATATGTQPIEEVKDGESSGHSNFEDKPIDDEMEPEAATLKAELAAKKERDEAVMTFERINSKAENTALAADSMMEDAAANTSLNVLQSAEDLNNLWQRIRIFLKGRDDEGNLVEHSQPGRVHFTKICEDRQRM